MSNQNENENENVNINVNQGYRTLILIVGILFASGIFVLLLGWTGYLPFMKSTIDNFVVANTSSDEETLALQKRELELIDEIEKQKIMEAITEEQKILEQQKLELQEKERSLQASTTALEEEKNNFLKSQELVQQAEKEKSDYQQRVTDLAATFIAMPPQRAVERIISLGDDVLIIDVMKAIDQKALETGEISISPFYYSLMDPKDASRILKKSAVTF